MAATAISTVPLRKPPLCLYSQPQTQTQIKAPDHSKTHDHKLAINGPSELSGHVAISGSKNAALPILAATLCCSGTSKITNVPSLSDTRTMASILGSLGAEVEVFDDEILVNTDGVRSFEPNSEEISKIRGGFFVVGPLLARFGAAVVAFPGGCDIGARPVDLYIRGLRALGAVVDLRDGKVQAYAANGRGLVGGRFQLDYPSVGATETLMMAASLADGVTVLSNVAKEPEVVSLAHFLRDTGACIEGAGGDRIVIKGKSSLHGSECTVAPDRIEAGSFMLAAAITRSCISISRVVPSDVSCLIDKLRAAGCKIRRCSRDNLEVSAVSTDGANLNGFDIKTGPFPAFPTDLQPQTMALLTTCDGSSIVEESVFERRMGHAHELIKLGARIQVCGSTALVSGKDRGRSLSGSSVVATDLRGGMSLVLAGLAANGTTEISGVEHIDRGYENLVMKLQRLGADVKKLVPLPCPPQQ
ncbi:UDP-N-acetylglucosamine 1-carboxyvinyltransferase [Trema orientale]|uniref:UDP-N-acetylglucosamine 1-carboxyvinyltransferase n=1 Tax=Trema orientale TaxID=63057 RepID=A0A2P5FL03_TREOI|nr:UDP-N-acetylglucosamine 1-carboxyvinyltransferase [Trema orientale]